jgi:hypothetical protein
MTNRFFITGLPRSRTAWLAAFMTSGNAICLHEPRHWRDMWAHDGARHVGISDSGLGFQLKAIINEFAPRILIVDRPIEEVEASLAALRIGIPRTNFCEILHKSLSGFNSGESNILRVPYHLLSDMRTMQKIFWHLTPGEAFDEGRFLAMKDHNIQIDIQHAVNYPSHHYAIPQEVVMQ